MDQDVKNMLVARRVRCEISGEHKFERKDILYPRAMFGSSLRSRICVYCGLSILVHGPQKDIETNCHQRKNPLEKNNLLDTIDKLCLDDPDFINDNYYKGQITNARETDIDI